MPEGDTVHGVADLLRRRVEGETLRRVAGSAAAVRRHAHRLRGARVEHVEAVGKHLLMDFGGGWSVRVHLGMTGRWRFGAPTGPRHDGAARLVLVTRAWAARCHGAPTVTIGRSPAVRAALAWLGPDLSLAEPDIDEALRRARLRTGQVTVTEVLLDQTVVAGIGNVYRNEAMFELGIHPETPLAAVDDATLARVLDRAARHLRANRGRPRTTTGARGPGWRLYVYDRAGLPCRRCGHTIHRARTAGRATFWCPGCQPG